MDLYDLKDADPARSDRWDAPEIDSAIAAVVAGQRARGLQRRRTTARVIAVGVAAAASVAIVIHLDLSPDAHRTGSGAEQPLSASFERAAAAYPLPEGSSYEPLRRTLLSGAVQQSKPFVVFSGRMPSEEPAQIDALVRRYAECRWVQVELAGTFDRLTPAEKAEVVEHTKAALARLEAEGRAPGTFSITRFWDELCRDAE